MIWIIGNKGLLGKEVAQYLAEQELPIIGTDKEVDILSPLALKRHLNKYNPDREASLNDFIQTISAEHLNRYKG